MYLVRKVFPSLRKSRKNRRSVCLQPPLVNESPPDDILQLVFEVYTHGLGLSPANLLTVCRRWYLLLVATPGIWSRVNISLHSIDTISHIIERNNPYTAGSTQTRADSPLLTYLNRSIPPNSAIGFPLDITIKSYFNYRFVGSNTRKFQSQLDNLIRHLRWGEPCAQRHKGVATNFVTRWRSLEINLSDMLAPHRNYPILDFAIFTKYGNIEMPSLQRLVCHRLIIRDCDRVLTPHLKHFEINGCVIDKLPSLRSMESLSLRGMYYTHAPEINWTEGKNIETLYIDPSFPYYFSDINLISNLTCIRLEKTAQYSLRELGPFFDDARPLLLLEIMADSPKKLTVGFRRTAPGFRVSELGISSYGFSGRPSTVDWEWLEYGSDTWNIKEDIIVDTMELLGVLEEFGGDGAIRVRAMDAQMDAILLRCKERKNIM